MFTIYKNRLLKLLILFLLIGLVLINRSCSNKEQLNYDFDTYLNGDSDFEKNIATVMPTKDELMNSKILYYMYYDNGRDIETSESKMVRLTVKYSDEDFVKAIQRMKEQAALYYSKQFYYNGSLYDGFFFHNNGYCAFAYNFCSDSNTISYLAFDCWELEFMDVEDALGFFPQFEYQSQIIPYE